MGSWYSDIIILHHRPNSQSYWWMRSEVNIRFFAAQNKTIYYSSCACFQWHVKQLHKVFSPMVRVKLILHMSTNKALQRWWGSGKYFWKVRWRSININLSCNIVMKSWKSIRCGATIFCDVCHEICQSIPCSSSIAVCLTYLMVGASSWLTIGTIFIHGLIVQWGIH